MRTALQHLGHERRFDRSYRKYYLAKIGIGMPIRVRTLRRKLSTASEAQDYGWRVIFRCRRIFQNPIV